MTKKKLFVEGL